jgi:protein TonB
MALSRTHAVGVATAIAGSALVLALVVLMNNPFTQRDKAGELIGSSIAVVKKEKPKPKEAVRKPEPPKRQTRAAPTPLLGLDASLSGLDFGLPAFDSSDLDLGQGLLGDSGDVVMTDDSVDQAPRPILQTPMAYPARAKAQGITGYVLLSVLISPTGQVEKVKVLEAQPAGVFDDVAAAGVQNWKFEPATYKGEQVRVWARQRVRFDLSRG